MIQFDVRIQVPGFHLSHKNILISRIRCNMRTYKIYNNILNSNIFTLEILYASIFNKNGAKNSIRMLKMGNPCRRFSYNRKGINTKM
jgi:hypothetical protein